MRFSVCSVLLAFVSGLAVSSSFAQDETVDPEAGDVSAQAASVAASSEGDASAAVGGSTAGPATPLSAGLSLGYGISLEDGPNIWGFGFGVRGGYNIDAVYLGMRFLYFVGEEPASIWELGIEGGYDVPVTEGFVIRPQLGLGLANIAIGVPEAFATPGSVGDFSESSTEFFLAGGVSGLYDVTDSMFIGAEARFQIVFAELSAKAITLMATAGTRF